MITHSISLTLQILPHADQFLVRQQQFTPQNYGHHATTQEPDPPMDPPEKQLQFLSLDLSSSEGGKKRECVAQARKIQFVIKLMNDSSIP